MICLPTWLDVVLFLATNYLAHGGSVLFPAGAHLPELCTWLLVALCLPTAELQRTLIWLMRHAECHVDDLHRSLAREALVIATRTEDWEPTNLPRQWDRVYAQLPQEFWDTPPVEKSTSRGRSGPTQETVRYAQFELVKSPWDDILTPVELEHYHHVGTYSLPPGYQFRIPAMFAAIQSIHSELHPTASIELTHTIPRLVLLAKAACACLQISVGIYSIYRARASEYKTYGYASPGFTVMPFTLMSLLNILALAFTRTYGAMHVLNTPLLAEAARRSGATIHGALGSLREEPLLQPYGRVQVRMRVDWTPARGGGGGGWKWLLVEARGEVRRFGLVPMGEEKPPAGTLKIGVARDTDTPVYALQPVFWSQFSKALRRRLGMAEQAVENALPLTSAPARRGMIRLESRSENTFPPVPLLPPAQELSATQPWFRTAPVSIFHSDSLDPTAIIEGYYTTNARKYKPETFNPITLTRHAARDFRGAATGEDGQALLPPQQQSNPASRPARRGRRRGGGGEGEGDGTPPVDGGTWPWFKTVSLLTTLFVGVFPLILLAGLTAFNAQSSPLLYRAFALIWLTTNLLASSLLLRTTPHPRQDLWRSADEYAGEKMRLYRDRTFNWATSLVPNVPFFWVVPAKRPLAALMGFPAIGGYYVVVKMLENVSAFGAACAKT